MLTQESLGGASSLQAIRTLGVTVLPVARTSHLYAISLWGNCSGAMRHGIPALEALAVVIVVLIGMP